MAIGRDALVVDGVDHREGIVAIGRVATDVVMRVRVVRKGVLRESLHLLSVVGLGGAVEILRLFLRMLK